MMGFRKISADSNGKTVAQYYYSEYRYGAPSDQSDQESDPKLATGDKIARYYTARPAGAQWRPNMPAAVARELGIDQWRPPTQDDIARLVEARRPDTGEKWTARKARKVSALDLTFSPHKSWSLASAFAPTEAERQMIYYCETQANERAMEYAAEVLGWARKGRNGTAGADEGEVGWVTVRHKTARPTLHVEDGAGGATHLVEVANAGDPQDHHHNLLFNLVVTGDGRVGSLDTKRLRDKVHEIGAVYQAWLAEYGRRMKIELDYDPKQEAAVITKVDPTATDAFSKRHRQVEGAAKALAGKRGLEWDALEIETKQKLMAETVLSTRMGKNATDEEGNQESWQAKAKAIGWTHQSVVGPASDKAPLTDAERFDAAYRFANRHLAKEFRNTALLSLDAVRTFAARGLIATGIKSTEEINEVTHLLKSRGITINGKTASLVFGKVGERIKVTNTEQIRLEETVLDRARLASRSRRGALSDTAIRNAIAASGLDFTTDREHGAAQIAAIHALGQGADLAVLLGAAGAGKTTLLKPLVAAYQADGRKVIGLATAWRQAQALRDTGIGEAAPLPSPSGRPTTRQSIREMQAAGTDDTYALTRFLRMVDRGDIALDDKTVLVVDEISQIGPRQFLRLLDLQASTGLSIKGLGDREQVQAIEAGDIIALLEMVLPPEALPRIETTIRQDSARDRMIASLFRKAEAKAALEFKREDGTARLVSGDYDQVVQRIADFYVERQDVLRAEGRNRKITVSTLTNDDAGEISRAIRLRLQTRGEIGQDDKIVAAIDQRGATYDLPLARGDRVRLFRQTRARFDDRHNGVIGNNGDVMEILTTSPDGITMADSAGRIGIVAWESLKDDKTKRIMLGFGHALTIDSAQGITSDEHINALPRGTAGATAFKTYVAESRHRSRSYTMIAEGALREAVTSSRAFGNLAPVTETDLWARAARDMAVKEYKPLGLDLVEQRRRRRERLLESWLAANRQMETSRAGGITPGEGFCAELQDRIIHQAVKPLVPAFERIIDQQDVALGILDRDLDRMPVRIAGMLTETAQMAIAARAKQETEQQQNQHPLQRPGPGL